MGLIAQCAPTPTVVRTTHRTPSHTRSHKHAATSKHTQHAKTTRVGRWVAAGGGGAVPRGRRWHAAPPSPHVAAPHPTPGRRLQRLTAAPHVCRGTPYNIEAQRGRLPSEQHSKGGGGLTVRGSVCSGILAQRKLAVCSSSCCPADDVAKKSDEIAKFSNIFAHTKTFGQSPLRLRRQRLVKAGNEKRERSITPNTTSAARSCVQHALTLRLLDDRHAASRRLWSCQ